MFVYKSNSLDINVDELPAQLGETNCSNEVEDKVVSAQKSQMYREQRPFCNEASFLYNLNDDFDGVQNQSSTNEQNDELYLVSSTLQFHMHEQHAPSCNDSSHEIQNQSSTNEHDDEFWNYIFINDDDAYLDEKSNEIFVWSESFDLLVGINSTTESSRKRSCIDDDGLNDVIVIEVSQTWIKTFFLELELRLARWHKQPYRVIQETIIHC